ncbi:MULTISPECIES: hypothetical protein [Paenibacillus]|uniref:Uncharacterized protein n=1 Tax=Paenibacillus odorifer TaxID=189426 RepID=A0A1R0WXN8_9BACL|nr:MULTISPECIES: hypothetical protein [Paenibacillus]AIQ75554.1 hypothetical protein PODO_21055 [Paenibacillus odorifer]ETT68371.1 hypothetical protein C171_01570 [Paenibacillus sp. FSL H8-237]MEC0132707.1 hypothetical protein [Paenibacillus odorifer]MEC0224542.1 hypothetical protein [Paenibacillus odorifer]OMC97274.1 hypothetical protein BJP49_09740 [Paenibacillus odorifer]
MKLLLLYFMLAFMGLLMAVIIDLLSGENLTASMRTIYDSFAATSIQESITMLVFISLPFVITITSSIRNRSNKSIK